MRVAEVDRVAARLLPCRHGQAPRHVRSVCRDHRGPQTDFSGPSAHVGGESSSDRPRAFIARSRLWIGSFLHGRIISGSFALPRVNLANNKVETYAATWDSVFSVGVGIENLEVAVVEAIASAARPAARAGSVELARLTDRSMSTLVKEIL